jgi:S-(hydroxymethyl)glutathione dehydrogenase/alcohol dehydrogenase
MLDGTNHFYKDGQPIFHYIGCSTFSKYTVLPEISLTEVNKVTPLEEVCLLGCAVTSSMGAVMNTTKVEESATMAKASQIIAININENKF